MSLFPNTLVLLSALNLTPPEVEPRSVARMPDAGKLSAFHELLASEPHVAGTPGDTRMAVLSRVSKWKCRSFIHYLRDQ